MVEQYFMPRRLDFKHLRLCIDNYQTDHLFIRDCGGYEPDGTFRLQGLVKVDEDLEGRSLDFRKDTSGLYLLIDSTEVFHFPLRGYESKDTKGFSLAYKRIEPTEDGIGRMVMLGTGINPYDENLPEPRQSFLRHILDDHLLEIYFQGMIYLKFHSWWQKPHWKYWKVVKEDPRK
ncbi:hypothetical protein J4421_06590 [Candidatus Woesearchaeota archaeon]|nr:hypothetical protein [Candidatus Woesearchaeota archaeon]